MQLRSLLALTAFGLTFASPIDIETTHLQESRSYWDAEAEYVEGSKEFWKRQDPVKPCATLHLIAISGEGIANKGSTGDLNTTYAAVKAQIPGSTHRNLPYPKGSNNGLGMTTVGAQNLKRWIAEYHTACPKAKIALVGYSSGGIIAMNTMCGASPSPPWPASAAIDPKYAKVVVAAIIYGDETFVGGLSYDRGTCTGVGRFPRTNTAGCQPFESSIQSYCDTEDPQCCLGDNGSAHFAYPTLYDSDAISFIQTRYADATKH